MTTAQRHLQLTAIFFAKMELWRGVRELTPNWHPRIAEYWASMEPPLFIEQLAKKPPWCGTFVQWVTDQACLQMGVENPLDGVKLEAYVQSYYQWAVENGKLVEKGEPAELGDLILFSFGGKRFDHIGFVTEIGEGGTVTTIEGNTGAVNQREGDGVHQKSRNLNRNDARLIRWS